MHCFLFADVVRADAPLGVLAFPLFSGLLWTVILTFDRLSLMEVLKNPWQNLVTSSGLSLWWFALLPFVAWDWPCFTAGFVALIGGMCFMLSNATYFWSMSQTDEPSEVATWDAMFPAITLVFSFAFFSKSIYSHNLVGLILILSTIFVLQWRRGRPTVSPWIYYGQLVFHTSTLALAYSLFDYAKDLQVAHLSERAGLHPGSLSADSLETLKGKAFWDVNFFFIAGLCSGFGALFMPGVAADFRRDRSAMAKFWWVFATVEICNVLAVQANVYAILYVHPAIATGLASSYPMLMYILSPIMRKRFGEKAFPIPEHPKRNMALLVLFMVGMALVAWHATPN